MKSGSYPPWRRSGDLPDATPNGGGLFGTTPREYTHWYKDRNNDQARGSELPYSGLA